MSDPEHFLDIGSCNEIKTSDSLIRLRIAIREVSKWRLRTSRESLRAVFCVLAARRLDSDQ